MTAPSQSQPRVPRVRREGGELLALRAWRLAWSNDHAGPVIGSLIQGTVWEGPVLRAHRKPAPAEGRAGVYALKPACRPRLDPASYADRIVRNWLTGPTTWIWGWVALSGQVVEHEWGYRAETAVIRRLHIGVATHFVYDRPEQLDQLVRDLEDRYQCPVKVGSWERRKAAEIRAAAAASGEALPMLPFVPLPTPRMAPRAPAVARRPAHVPTPLERWLGRAAHRLVGLFFAAGDWLTELIAREVELLLFQPRYASDPAARFYDARRPAARKAT